MPELTPQDLFAQAREHERAGRLSEAELGYRQCLAMSPQHGEALYRLGVLAGRTDRDEEAIVWLRRAIAAQPTEAKSHSALGEVLHQLGRREAALSAHLIAARLAPQDAEIQFHLGLARWVRGELDAALAALSLAIGLKPGFAAAYRIRGTVLQQMGRLDEAIDDLRRAVAVAPNWTEAHDSLVFILHGHPAQTPATLRAEQALWNERHAVPLRPLIRAHPNNRDPERRLKIGYVSSDFHVHTVSHSTVPLFSHHDRAQFEVFAYASVQRPDAITQRLQSCTDVWRDVNRWPDEQLSERIRADGIDLLLDLNLHTAGNRLLVFARKPAPVQISWAGFPGSTGLDTIDYRLTDPFLDPPGQPDAYSAERVFHLQDCFWHFDPLGHEPPVSPPPFRAKGQITFGCLCRFDKINPEAIMVWAQILNAVPDSRLLALAPLGSARARTLDMFAREGTNPARIEFMERRPRPEYLALHQQIDIALDPFPYGGQLTLCDGLWMGVPAITLPRQIPNSRAGLSLLANVGLPELVARDESDYVRIAVGLARDFPRLAALRTTLRPRLLASPLMDAPRFARDVESAYRTMWRRWCAAQ